MNDNNSPQRSSCVSSPDFGKPVNNFASNKSPRAVSNPLRVKKSIGSNHKSLRSQLINADDYDSSPIRDLDQKLSPYKVQMHRDLQSKPFLPPNLVQKLVLVNAISFCVSRSKSTNYTKSLRPAITNSKSVPVPDLGFV